MDFSNLMNPNNFSINDFTHEQKRSCLLTWVGKNLRLKLKEYNLSDAPTGYSTKLWAVGRGNIQTSKTFMENRVKEHIKIATLSADDELELKEILEEMTNEIVEHSLIVSQDLFSAARRAKTQSVRNKYYKAVNNPEYLKVVLIISISSYADSLKKNGHNINHVFLSTRLDALKDCKRELNQIWIYFAETDRNENDYNEAQDKTEMLLNKYENEHVVNNSDLEKLAEEQLIYKLMGEDNLNQMINIIVENMRERITGEVRLIN